MKIRRVLYSKLPKSRIGIGWVQEGNGKNKSEKHMRRAQEAAEDSWDEDEDEERAVNKAKSAATRSVLGDESFKIGAKSLGAAALGYGASRYLREVDKVLRKSGTRIFDLDPNAFPKIPEKVLDFSRNNSGKIAAGVGLGTLIYQANKNKLGKKLKAARTGAEINTRDRVKKYNKKREEDED
jgi:hypothetical protein